MPGEFALIDRIRARVRSRADVLLGIGDDAAVLRVPAGHDLVVTSDTLVSGVHFPAETSPADIGWKALAVNLSDLAAMAATPAWCTLAITLPDADGDWVDAFLDGFLDLAQQHDVCLVGGDTTRGPLSITVTAHGIVPEGLALRRDGAHAGDEVWVTGSIGDAAGALAQWRARGPSSAKLRYRLDRPTPRVAAGLALRGIATAGIDLSDGLAADLGHVLAASGLGARIDLGRLPTSRTLADHFDEAQRWPLQLSGGDDYELCFTAPASAAFGIEKALASCGVTGTVIGQLVTEPGLHCTTPEGEDYVPAAAGFEHFQGVH
ncbi:MAG: thiamine-phosphate kinase [Arenimonas sp.]|uniref:thiamine-phosphate kinase n=1 Tax=Arenimonas sp. TaxID=1872635 RepID=UPI0025BA87BF|nr:thiamine-phosphate kinase [Arenimonas sp.]MBW8366630.1 thiamine-phosphate kinase [Arenimonas sp.]